MDNKLKRECFDTDSLHMPKQQVKTVRLKIKYPVILLFLMIRYPKHGETRYFMTNNYSLLAVCLW